MSIEIGYKLFRVLKTQPGKIFPLYVKANQEIPIGKWINAECGERTITGKVKSKLGPLKYRPGFHINDKVPYVSHIGKKNSEGKITFMRSDLVWAEVEYHTDKDYCVEAKQNGFRGNKYYPAAADLDYIPVNGFYKYKTNPTMTGEWIIAGEMKVNRILNDDEVKRLCSENGFSYLPREEEFDYKKMGFVA